MNEWSEAEQHVERAHEHYEAGRWTEAETELREALSLNPYKAEWHFNLGLTLEAAGRWEDAIAAFESAHELEPGDAQTLLVLGVNSLRTERFERAVAWFEEAERFAPDAADSFVYRIEAFGRLDRHDDAELMFYQALQRDGDHALAYANMAECLLDRNDNKRALYCLREAASLDPSLPRVHARLAHAFAATGRHERARQLYARELRENPGDIETLLDLGCLLLDMNRLAEAGEKFRRVLEIEPENVDAHFFLGDLAARQHRFDAALKAFRLVLRLDGRYAGARRRAADLLIREGRLGEARRLLRQDVRRLFESPESFAADDMEELGDLLLDVRLPRDAARVFFVLVARRSDDPAAWHRLSVSRLRSGDRRGGMAAARRAVRLDAECVPALHNLALAAMHHRQWRLARAYLRRAVRADSDDVLLRRLRLAFWTMRTLDAARRLLRRARLVAPE